MIFRILMVCAMVIALVFLWYLEHNGTDGGGRWM